LNFGGIGRHSVTKLVKPIKTLGSWTPHDSGVNHFLFSKTKAHIRTAAAGILGKANAAVRQKVCRLDSPDRALHQAGKLPALFVGDRSAQILNLDEPFADENGTPANGRASGLTRAGDYYYRHLQAQKLLQPARDCRRGLRIDAQNHSFIREESIGAKLS
jgi:hypothetical protein